MDRRRALAQRPASSEGSALRTFRDKYNEPSTGEAIARVNRLISAWPATNGDDSLPMDGFESARNVYKKLNSGLNEVKATAEAEAKAIDQALESVSVLIGLRKAPELNVPPLEKRSKRPRGSSPSPLPGIPSMTPANRITLSVKSDRDRGSESPAPQPPFRRDAKARTRYYAKQGPLLEGRKVAFQPPSESNKTSDTAVEGEESPWILAIITRCTNVEKHKYEVQDAEPTDTGQLGQIYPATFKNMIPLPDPDASMSSLSHPNSYPEFPAGFTVMALYPDTSCFYRAEVIQGPRDPQNTRTVPSSRQQPAMYRLKFEDDDDQVHSVAAQWVVEFPVT